MNPIALPPIIPTRFLDYILQHHKPPTTIIICSTREAFLEEIKASILPSTAPSSAEPVEESVAPLSHHLLHPTIHLIAISRTVNLAYTPSLPHLRAYLATYHRTQLLNQSTSGSGSTSRRSSSEEQQRAILAIWGFASIHRSTTDHSAQGLSRTLAVAVEAAHLAGQQLVLAESANGLIDEPGEVEDGRGLEVWREQVPLLNGIVRLGGEESGLIGRTVQVGSIVRRWCRFVRLEGVEDGGWRF